MNKEIEAKWCAWLRDPENKQTTGALHKGDAFCCLGGLCEVYRKEKGNAEWLDHNLAFDIDARKEPVMKYSFLNAVGTLPYEVANWAGISDGIDGFRDISDPEVITPFGRWNLSVLNDGFSVGVMDVRRLTFAEIADIIEANPDL